jgi:hypothetical protein
MANFSHISGKAVTVVVRQAINVKFLSCLLDKIGTLRRFTTNGLPIVVVAIDVVVMFDYMFHRYANGTPF